MKFGPEWFAELLIMVWKDVINQTSAKVVLTEMFSSGLPPNEIVAERTLMQISNEPFIGNVVDQILSENPDQVAAYLNGREALRGWFFGQVMRRSEGRANPKIVEKILNEKLAKPQEIDE